MSTFIHNAKILYPDGIAHGTLNFGRCVGDEAPEPEWVDGCARLVTPGLIDLHIHGVGAHAFEQSAEDLRAGLRLLPQFGVTTVLPTLYRSLRPESLDHLARLALALDTPGGARAPGFHLEGPFLAITGAGALTTKPDVGLLEALLAACGRAVAMSISPELPGIIAVIERLREKGVTPFITHTQASAEQTQLAIDAGAHHATHFYDVFPPPPEREPGVRPAGAVETLLADPRATVDFICDGVHVHPAAIRAALAAKGRRGVVAITDANVGAGMRPGTYPTPWGYSVDVAPGDAARIADRDHPQHGQLAGSALTLNAAVANLRRIGVDETTAWSMATHNPARVVGLHDRGSLQPARSADLVLWDDDYHPRQVWIEGHCVYEREPD